MLVYILYLCYHFRHQIKNFNFATIQLRRSISLGGSWIEFCCKKRSVCIILGIADLYKEGACFRITGITTGKKHYSVFNILLLINYNVYGIN